MTMQSLVRDELRQITITISSPSGFPGSVWNVGEFAWVTVTVRNTTGLPLRDVVADAHVGSSASISPISFFGIQWGDGEQEWDELDPGEASSYNVRLRANSAGNAHFWVGISAEVVPYASHGHITHRDLTIIGA